MPPNSLSAAILLADISGSTRLYEAAGDAQAQHLISRELIRLQAAISDAGGVYVRQKGDDVLGYFVSPGEALQAVRAMLSRPPGLALTIHAGLHYGQIVRADGDIFGEAVNLTARLAAHANGGEALLSRSLVDQLAASETGALRPLGPIRLRGIGNPIDVFSLIDDDTWMRTSVVVRSNADLGQPQMQAAIPQLTVVLTHDHKSQTCREAEQVLIGRSAECNIVLPRPWVSRKHAVVSVLDGKLLLEDRSASGTYVLMDGGHELFLRRETIMLTGNGAISPAVRLAQPEADPVTFETIFRA